MNKLKLMTIGFVLFNALVLQESYGGYVFPNREPKCGDGKIYSCGTSTTASDQTTTTRTARKITPSCECVKPQRP